MPSTEQPWLRLETDGNTATLFLATGAGNPWHEAALLELNEQVTALARDERCRCLIITGQEDARDEQAWFSSGLQTRALERDDPLLGANLARLFTQAFGALRRFPGVTLAAINGHAHNEGLAWALNCDFRIAGADAGFRFNAGSQGRVAFGGGTQLLPRLVGESWAKRLLLMEAALDARQALAIGLVDEVVPADEVMVTARAWAEQCLRQTPMAARAGKQLIEHARMRPLETGFAAEREWQAGLYEAGEHRNPGRPADSQ
ncbi:MAG: enoyl-CoA hydratase-related protein [Marinobacter sp.]|uniref:enoyl-CoA hydratase-related protein n=1 Tax=Marinobacter sp. TaxID=50741 RepID=UPI00299F0AF4|nr:enoyl-CoA hydratase-related protein [Marinobacter sp.]MDX1634879.1 enoyl-CoA hydratase-related protein [Marinobacter sp.]